MRDDPAREFLKESNAIEDVFDEKSLEDAWSAWKYLWSKDHLTPSVVLETHRILMARQGLHKRDLGRYRTCEVSVGGRVCSYWRNVPELIKEWCQDTMAIDADPKDMHVLYERIHPFVDGNGRTGRMFMNWSRRKRYGLPILIIKAAERQEYYKWFK